MVGLVPKTVFLGWLRNPLASKDNIPEQKMKQEMSAHRASMLYHFTKHGKVKLRTQLKMRGRKAPSLDPASPMTKIELLIWTLIIVK